MKIGGKHIFPEYKPIGYVKSPLGKLAIFSISYGDMEKVQSKTGISVKGVQPQELAQRLLPFILHKDDSLKEDGTKPDAPTLTEEQVRALPDDVVEATLGFFIESQEYLYRPYVTKVTTNDKGERVHSMSFGEVQHPKQPGESNVAYLHRLLVLDEEKIKRQMAKLADSLLGASHFSAGLNQSIKNTLLMGDSMSKALETLRLSAMPDLSKLMQQKLVDLPPALPSPELPSIDYAAIAKSAEKARWAPFNAVNQRLDQLVEHAVTSGKFMVAMNQTQTQIAAEIKASSDDATKIGTASLKIAKWGFWLTMLVVLLTVVGLGITMASWWSSDDTVQRAEKHAQQITGGLSDMKNALVNGGQSSAREMRGILDELKNGRIEQSKKFDAIFAEQTKLLDCQSTQHAADQAIIDTLGKRITQLEDEIRKLQAQSK